ncbi:head-tail connector protein [Serratia fonticola]|uniref:head-tail connector protein n=1 Tax=Serratia fonticola TaxID=47917 RepID=UPI003AAD8CD9
MIELVSLEQAKAHLRIDDDYGDDDLTLKIQGGSAAILAYIQGSRDLIVGENGAVIQNTEALTRVQNALLVLLGYMDRNRGGEEEEKLQQGNLPVAVTMLIYDLREPSVI